MVQAAEKVSTKNFSQAAPEDAASEWKNVLGETPGYVTSALVERTLESQQGFLVYYCRCWTYLNTLCACLPCFMVWINIILLWAASPFLFNVVYAKAWRFWKTGSDGSQWHPWLHLWLTICGSSTKVATVSSLSGAYYKKAFCDFLVQTRSQFNLVSMVYVGTRWSGAYIVTILSRMWKIWNTEHKLFDMELLWTLI